VERVHDRDRVGKLFSNCGLEPGEPVHRDDLDPVPARTAVRSMITVTYLSPRRV
jgi:hypothetical protein